MQSDASRSRDTVAEEAEIVRSRPVVLNVIENEPSRTRLVLAEVRRPTVDVLSEGETVMHRMRLSQVAGHISREALRIYSIEHCWTLGSHALLDDKEEDNGSAEDSSQSNRQL